ncbi:PEP-CTERM sorting domain-containing protein [Chlamydiota bacterium]
MHHVSRKRKKKGTRDKEQRKLLEKRLLTYSVALGAIVIAAKATHGAIIYTDLTPDVIIDGGDIYYLDLNDDSTIDFRIAHSSATYVSTYLIILDQNNNKIAYNTSSSMAAALDASSYPAYFGMSPPIMADPPDEGQWIGVTDKYLGLKFQIGANWHYGWARLDVADLGGNCVGTLKDYAYDNTPDTPIHMGATGGVIPEPSSIALLALGAAGLAWQRKKKKKGDR